jgi:deferrochelatase/peroxidase EfeB
MAGVLQEGIYHTPGNRPGRFFTILFLRVPRETTAVTAFRALAALWAMYRQLKVGTVRDLPNTTVPTEKDNLTTLLGVGPKVFTLPGAEAPLPAGLAQNSRFRSPEPAGGGPLLRGSGLNYASEVNVNPATEEFCVQFIADTKLATDRAIVETWKMLDDLLLLHRISTQRSSQLDRLP